jgi:UPF0271 protein
MNLNKKSKIFILDTSVILSGKPIDFDNVVLVTASSVYDELTPGGRDYQRFQLLIEKGLSILSVSKESVNKVNIAATETGDAGRLSKTDFEILALALDITKKHDKVPIIITDDYSIQNVADYLKIRFKSFSQSGITKRFKWTCRCLGCRKQFKDNISYCPICGAETQKIISEKRSLRK